MLCCRLREQQYFDLDGDTLNDLGLAEDCCRADNTWTYTSGLSTQAFLCLSKLFGR